MVAQLAAADAKTERRIKEESFGLKQAFTLMCATGVAMVLVVSVVVGWCCARRNQLTTEEFDTLFSILAVNPDTQTHKTLRSGKTYSPSTGPALLLITFASYTSNYWIQWTFITATYFFLILVDFMFLDESDFVYDPEKFEIYEPRTRPSQYE